MLLDPMSAVLLEKNKKKIIYPSLIQPKLDGFRGMAKLINNEVIIYSRTKKPFIHLKNIKKELKKFKLIKDGKTLDGEIYLHNHSIGDLKSVMGRLELNNNKIRNLEKKIKYYVFDYVDIEKDFKQRYNILKNNFPKSDLIKLVKTKKVSNFDQLNKTRNQFINEGYEGIIVRNMKGIYQPGKRSIDVFRSKEFKKGKFTVIDGLEGKGVDKGTVIWKLQCSKNKNNFFMAKPMGTRDFRKKLYKERKKFIGKKITIKYFEINEETGCVSRFPIAI